MNTELKAKWVRALRSKKYRQARGVLRKDSRTFCCIGVGAIVADKDFDFSMVLGTSEASRRIGLTDAEREQLINMNDYDSATFPEIADYIEANL